MNKLYHLFKRESDVMNWTQLKYLTIALGEGPSQTIVLKVTQINEALLSCKLDSTRGQSYKDFYTSRQIYKRVLKHENKR